MKRQKENMSGSSILRQKAEKFLKNKPLATGSHLNEIEVLRLVHELQVHQIELDLQNEELMRAKEEAEVASQKYTELYDFAPSGYFTLTKEGMIVELNLRGSNMLGKPRSVLINSVFTFFVSDDTKSIFNLFLIKIFSNKTRQTCEVILSSEDNLPLYVYLTGIVRNNGIQCIIDAIDISEKRQVEEALRKSEENNRTIILQTAMDGFWLVDMQGKLLEVNETYCRMSGYSAQELLSMDVSDLEAVESKNETASHIQKTLEHGEDRFETSHRRKDGSIFNLEISVQYQPLEGGRMVAFLHDITERKLTEAALLESETKFRKYIDFAPHGVFVANEIGEYIEVNSSACKITGYNKDELLSMKISDFVPEESIGAAVQHFTKVKKEGFASGEFPFIKKDKTIGYWSVDAVNLSDQLFLGFVVDTTERRQAEETLIESERRYRSLFEESNDAIFLVDVESGSYIDCNRLAEKLTGYTREEILNLKTGALLPPQRKNETLSNIEIIVSQNLLRKETEIITKDGKLIPIEFNSSKIEINKKLYILSMLHDISDRKAAGEALKQSEERVRFKLQSILSPEGSIAELELNDIIDVQSIQKLMDDFYELVQIPMAIIDLKGEVLVGVGWQDICIKFHRVHPLACRNCFESDVHLTQGIPDGEFRLYKCKNNMWDMATPLIIGSEHKGNLYLGQFFLENEPINYEQFSNQARQYGFEEQEYLDALDKVPRLNKHNLDHAKEFFLSLSRTISQLSYSNIKLARAMEQQRKVESELREKDELFNKAQKIAHVGSWSLDLVKNNLTWSDEMYRIFDVLPHEFNATYEGFLDSVYPDDRDTVNAAYTGSIRDGKNNYEVEHRILRKHSGELRHVYEKCEHVRDASGKIIGSIGMTHDITELKQSAEALREKERLFRESQAAANIASYSVDLVKKTWKATPSIYEIFGIDETYPQTLDSWMQCVHPDFRTKLISDLNKPEIRKNIFEHEYKIIRVNDDAERWVYGIGNFEYDSQMNPIGVIGTIQDITKRKLAEEALKQLNEELDNRVKERTAELLKSNIALQRAEEKYRTIADFNYDWETWLGPDGKFIYVSPSCYRISGYSVDEFMNDQTLFYRIAHPDDREKVEKHFYDSLKSDNPDMNLDFRIITRKGEEKWISHSCQCVYNKDGQWLGQRGSNSDITVRKKVESFLVNSQDQLRALTHHINELTENERKNIAREIHDELGHMLTALKYDIDNLLSNSDLSIELVKSDLSEMFGMVESLIDSVRKIATELRPGILDHLGLFPAMEWQINQFRMMTKIKCTYVLPDDLDVTFNKNETTTIFRILQEILTNIARHSKAKEVAISVQKQNDVFLMKADDNGVGFNLIDNFQSTSLGLLGMQERALSIGGEIHIESEPFKGTSVTLLLNK